MLLFYTLVKMPEFRVEREHMKIERQVLGEISQFSFLTCIQQSVMNFGILMVQGLVNSFGAVVMAAFAAAVKIDSFAYMPVQDFGNAFSTYVAQNYGAGKPERARRSLTAGIGFAVLASSVFFLWAQLSPHTMIGLFNTNPEIIEAGIPFFQSCSFDYLAVSFVFCLNGFMNGRSKTVFTMVSCCFGKSRSRAQGAVSDQRLSGVFSLSSEREPRQRSPRRLPLRRRSAATGSPFMVKVSP